MNIFIRNKFKMYGPLIPISMNLHCAVCWIINSFYELTLRCLLDYKKEFLNYKRLKAFI